MERGKGIKNCIKCETAEKEEMKFNQKKNSAWAFSYVGAFGSLRIYWQPNMKRKKLKRQQNETREWVRSGNEGKTSARNFLKMKINLFMLEETTLYRKLSWNQEKIRLSTSVLASPFTEQTLQRKRNEWLCWKWIMLASCWKYFSIKNFPSLDGFFMAHHSFWRVVPKMKYRSVSESEGKRDILFLNN